MIVMKADVAVLRLHRGQFGFIDVRGGRKVGTQKLEAELAGSARKSNPAMKEMFQP